MTEFIKITKHITGDNRHIHDSFMLPYRLLAIRDNHEYDFTIYTHDFEHKPDCVISDFGNNVYYRPAKACNLMFKGYSSYANLSRAVKNTLIKRGFTIKGWHEGYRWQ